MRTSSHPAACPHPKARSHSRLLAALGSALFCLAALFVLLSLSFKGAMLEARKAELGRLTALASYALEPVLVRERAGLLSRDEARAEAAALLRTFVYGDDTRKNYLFMSAYDGTMLVQPFEPWLEGSSQWDLRDADGVFPVRELVRAARSGGGYVAYRHLAPGSRRPETKVSFVLPVEGLEAYLGTGFYRSDIDHQAFRLAAPVLAGAGLIVLAFALFVAYGLRPFYAAYRRLLAAFAAAAESPGKPPVVTLQGFRPGSEARCLLESFNGLAERLAAYDEARGRLELRLKGENAEKHLLLKEVHHRVKNNLQIVSSLLSLQARARKEARCSPCLGDSTARIQSMAEVHELLYESGDFSRVDFARYAERLVVSAAEAAGMGARVDLRLEPLSLSLDQAIPCGLFLNEALTNAFKYGTEAEGEGRISVSLGSSGSAARLEVSDGGPGFPDDVFFPGAVSFPGAAASRPSESGRGLGLMLMETLAGQLKGEISASSSDGARLVLEFPLPSA